MINSEVELDLSWTKNCVLAENDANLIDATFQINNTKLYVPLVTWSINDNIKFLENMKQGFKRIVFWNKYRSQITTQLRNNDLDYMIDPAFSNINRLSVLLLKNDSSDPTRGSFDKYNMSLV